MSYNSKYTGAEVEGLLDQVKNGGGDSSGSVDLSEYATKTELEGKVDKVDGKQLSTEDFTTLLKEKLDGLSNYDDTEIIQAVESLRSDFDALVSGDTTSAIEAFNEVVAFLNGLEDTESLEGIIASIEQQIAAKQDKLVSGTNIKTVNGQSILGEGNIEITGGSSAYPVVHLDQDTSVYTLNPNTFYVWEVAYGLELSLGEEIEGVMNEYLFQFWAGSQAPSLTLPDTVCWAEDGIYAIVPGFTYRVSIINGLAKMTKFYREGEEPVMPMTLYYNPAMDTPLSTNPKAALLYGELMDAKDDDGIVLLEEGMLYFNIDNYIMDNPTSPTELKWETWTNGDISGSTRSVTGFLLFKTGGAYILGEDGVIYYLDHLE